MPSVFRGLGVGSNTKVLRAVCCGDVLTTFLCPPQLVFSYLGCITSAYLLALSTFKEISMNNY